jgi:hypothetical protein
MVQTIAEDSGTIDLGGIRQARVTGLQKLTDLSRTTVTTGWKLRATDGQTLYVTKQRRKA